MSNIRPEPFQNGLGGSAEGQRNPYQTTERIAWVCDACGRQFGTRVPTAATWHVGKCDICVNEHVPVTQPRDYGVPRQ